jgi:urease accessory protein
MIHVFKALPLVREVHSVDRAPDRARSYARDTLTLGWEERRKARARRRSDRGVEFGTALARGTVLKAGDLLVCDEVTICIAILESAEPVLVIRPADGHEWALFAYHIGNSHQPLMLDATAIVCPDVPGMNQVLEYHDIAFTRDVRPFTPVGDLPEPHGHAR